MSILIFCQNMGGAVSLVAANAIFSNTLRRELAERVSEIGVDPEVIVGSGARSVRQIVSGNALRPVLEAYSNSIDAVMYLGIAVSIMAFAFGWGLGFKDIRKEKQKVEAEKVGNNGVSAGSDTERGEVSAAGKK